MALVPPAVGSGDLEGRKAGSQLGCSSVVEHIQTVPGLIPGSPGKRANKDLGDLQPITVDSTDLGGLTLVKGYFKCMLKAHVIILYLPPSYGILSLRRPTELLCYHYCSSW